MQFTDQIKKQVNKIRQFKMQEDRAVLLSCFGIALIFWVLVKLSQEYTSQKPVSFTYEAPEELALANLPPQDISATLKGTGWNLIFEYLAHSSIPVHFNINEIGAFRLNRAQLKGEVFAALASKELEVMEVNYDELNLKVEERASKRIPVVYKASLEFSAEHHLAGLVTLEPDSVTITGATSVVDSYSSWPTDSVRITNLSNTVSPQVPLKQAPPEVQLSNASIALNIPVEAYTEKSLFVPVTLKNAPPDSLKVFPDKIKVSFVVGLSQYDSVHFSDFILEADLKVSSLEKGKNTVPVHLTKVPEFVNNVLLSRKSVEFFILKSEETPKEAAN